MVVEVAGGAVVVAGGAVAVAVAVAVADVGALAGGRSAGRR